MQEFEAEKAFLQRSCRLLEEIRRTNDVDRKWAVADLVDALRFIKMTRTALVHHFEWCQNKEISLRDLMDLAVSEKRDARKGYVITPLLDFRCVGVKGFRSVVDQLTNLDLGESCNGEWRKRLERLKRGWRIKGVRSHSWSKPFKPRPEWTTSTESVSLTRCENTTRLTENEKQ